MGAIDKHVCKDAAMDYLGATEVACNRLEPDKASPAHMLPAAASLYDATGDAWQP